MKNDLATKPDVYTPTIKDNRYEDYIPFDFERGFRCPCSTRKEQFYSNRQQFKSHLKAQKHKDWIIHLNNNRNNYFQKCIENQETIKNQRILIAKFEKKIAKFEKEIKVLKDNSKNDKIVPVGDLLDMDIDP